MQMLNGLQGLKHYRQRAGLTQRQLAQELGVSREAVAMWESGKAWPSASLLPLMADYLLCSIDDLYRSQEDFNAGEEVCPCKDRAEIRIAATAELPA